MLDVMSVNGVEYTIIRLLGKGKGGYSYLVERDNCKYVWLIITLCEEKNNLKPYIY